MALDDEYELALDEALDRIRGDSNESDEDFFELDSSTSPRIYNSNYNTNSTCVKLLCMPHRTRQATKLQYHLPSSTTRSSNSTRRVLPREITVKNTQTESLTQSEFCSRLCQKLLKVQKERVVMKEQVKDMATKAGKSYMEIMSLDWYDSPKCIKYIDTRRSLTKLHPSCSIDSGLGYSNQLSFTNDPQYFCNFDDCSSNYSNPELFIPPRSSSSSKMTSLSAASLSSLSSYHSSMKCNSKYTSASSSSRYSSHSAPNNILVAYTMDDTKKTFKTTIPVRNSCSLRDFKENVFFNKRGCYRFFFKTYCSELDNVVYEEISGDTQTLPLYEGKIVAHIEQVNTDTS